MLILVCTACMACTAFPFNCQAVDIESRMRYHSTDLISVGLMKSNSWVNVEVAREAAMYTAANSLLGRGGSFRSIISGSNELCSIVPILIFNRKVNYSCASLCTVIRADEDVLYCFILFQNTSG